MDAEGGSSIGKGGRFWGNGRAAGRVKTKVPTLSQKREKGGAPRDPARCVGHPRAYVISGLSGADALDSRGGSKPKTFRVRTGERRVPGKDSVAAAFAHFRGPSSRWTLPRRSRGSAVLNLLSKKGSLCFRV